MIIEFNDGWFDMTLEVFQFPCLGDNYGFLIHDSETGKTGSIDTPEAQKINEALEAKGWQLDYVLNTHHHFDHAGGNEALKERWGCTIIGAANDAARIPGIDHQVSQDDTISIGNSQARVLEVPGHTSGHIAYYFADDGIAFVGDTLFALGCGRLFEGTPDQMWNSLQKLMALPGETVVYCAHEYTQANAAFALSVDPNNPDLQARAQEIDKLRAQNKPTVPTTIAIEMASNPFLRPDSTLLQQELDLVGSDLVTVFAETRRRKDNF